ncbi:L,D-transpeptidase family protein [Bacillus tianshenii]|nr:L,D-transpeptidase family protein [Bacillus tianshenii]MCA1319057.1 L,D-transpeptidase family protein [Bacillus tianshenii]
MAIHIVKRGETLTSIAMDYRRTVPQLLAVNALPDPNILLVGQQIIIPGLAPKESIPFTIEVSVSKRTLTLKENGAVRKVYPIAVGRMLFYTPVGDFVIVNRQPNPGGPFGTMWLTLSKRSYGIHGTNDPSSIGKAVSKGCIRMQNLAVNELSSLVPNGTAVYIRP